MRLETFPTFAAFNKTAALNLLFLGQSSSLFLSVRENGAPLLCRGHTTQPDVVVKLCVAAKHFPLLVLQLAGQQLRCLVFLVPLCACAPAQRGPHLALSPSQSLCTPQASTSSLLCPIHSLPLAFQQRHRRVCIPFIECNVSSLPPSFSSCCTCCCCCLLFFAVHRAVLAVVDCTVGRSLRLRRCCSRESESERCSGRHGPQQTFLLWAARVRSSTGAPQRPCRATAPPNALAICACYFKTCASLCLLIILAHFRRTQRNRAEVRLFLVTERSGSSSQGRSSRSGTSAVAAWTSWRRQSLAAWGAGDSHLLLYPSRTLHRMNRLKRVHCSNKTFGQSRRKSE